MFFKKKKSKEKDDIWEFWYEESKNKSKEKEIPKDEKYNDTEPSKKRKKKKIRLSSILFFISFVLLAYLLVSRIQLARLNLYTMDNYINNVSRLKTNVTQRLKDKEYNEKLKNGEFMTGKKPEFDKSEDDSRYKKDIKINKNIIDPIGAMYIPKLGISYPVYDGTSPWILDNGIGIMEKTSKPGGLGTNCVLTAHRGTQNGDFFRHLDILGNGDSYYIVYNGEVLKYSVVGTDIVVPTDTSKITIDPNKDKTTLLTCTPYLINTERLLKHGERVELKEGEREYVINKIKDMTVPGYKRMFKGRSDKDNNKYNKDSKKSVKDNIKVNSGKIFTFTLIIFIIITLAIFVLRNRRSKDL